MIDLTPIAEPIQKRLFEKMKLLGRGGTSANVPVSIGGLTHNQLAVRSPFIRMVSGLQDPVILMGGELINETSADLLANTSKMAAGYDEIYGQRSYIKNEADSLNPNWKPEIGGDNKFKRPMPGFKSITAQFKGGIRALREGTINWTCWSFDDINRLMPHFLTVGPSVLIEWGWVYGKDSLSNLPTFFSSAENKIKRSAYNNYKNTIIDANGDFDMMIGIIKNFEWTTRDDGGFDCTTTLTSAGVNTLGTIQPPSNKPATTLKLSASDTIAETKAKLEAGEDNPLALLSLNWSVSVKTFMKNIDNFLRDRVMEIKTIVDGRAGTKKVKQLKEKYKKRQQEIETKGFNSHITYEENEFIIIYKVSGNRITKITDAWVRWGWFEDNILSKFTTVVPKEKGDIISEFRSVEKLEDESGKEGPLYESVRIRNHPKLKTTNLSKYILPGQFFPQKKVEIGEVSLDGDDTELKILGTVVNNVSNFKPFDTKGKTITEKRLIGVISKEFKFEPKGDYANYAGPGNVESGATYAEELQARAAGQLDFKEVEYQTAAPAGAYGYLRNMLINTKLIKEAFGVSEDDSFTVQSITITDALRTMFRLLNEDVNIWKFQLSGDTTNPQRNKIVDTQITVPLPPPGTKVNDSYAKLPGTRSTYNNATGEVHDGVFFFPVWRHDSLVKSQTLNATIPNALAISAMYGNSYDSFKTGGDTPDQVSSEEAYAAGKIGKDALNPSVKEEGLDIALNQRAWKKIGTPPNVDSLVELTSDASDVDIRKWLYYNPKYLKQTAQSRITSIEKNIAAVEEAEDETEISDILNDSTPVVFLDDLINMKGKDGKNVGQEAFENIKMYKDVPSKLLSATDIKSLQRTEGSKFTQLYSSIFESTTKDEKKMWKMKEPWIDAVRFDIMGKTTKKGKISAQEQPLLLPLTLSLSIDGIGGIFPGNSFHSTYVPKRYQEDAIFQVFDVNHSVDSTGWSVEVGGMMRSTMERVQHIEWETIPKEIKTALERFTASKLRWDTQQIKDYVGDKVGKVSKTEFKKSYPDSGKGGKNEGKAKSEYITGQANR